MGLCEADPVTVYRWEDTDEGPTNSWTLSAWAGEEANLFKFEPIHKAMNITQVGRFHLPFSITVEKQ